MAGKTLLATITTILLLPVGLAVAQPAESPSAPTPEAAQPPPAPAPPADPATPTAPPAAPAAAAPAASPGPAPVAPAPAPPPPYPYTPVYEPPPPDAQSDEERGVRTHDGFYLRFGIGVGYVHNSIEDSGLELEVSGTTLAIELMIGGSPVPGLAIGGGFWVDPLLDPSVEFAGQSVSVDSARVQLTRLGPFVDFYPDPKGGLHLLGAVTLTAFSLTDNDTDETVANARGPGFAAGVGYEWWIGEQWSAGVMARFVYASLSAESESHSLIAPGLIATFTMH